MNEELLILNSCRNECRSRIILMIPLYLFLQLFFITICQAQQNYPRIDSSNFQYLGAFRLPQLGGESGFAYGGGAMTYNKSNNSLFLTGHSNLQRVAEVLIPTSIIKTELITNLSIANFAQNTFLTDVTEGKLHNLGADGASIGSEVHIGGFSCI